MIDIISDEELNDIYKLKNLIRYNTRNKLKNESVAEHSFYVALISLMLCDKYSLNDKVRMQCMTKALLHDMPEIEINDITHDAKQRLNITKLLAKYEDDYYKRNFAEHARLMKHSDKLVTLIVDLADALSVRQYVNNEIKLGNASCDIMEINNEIDNRINKLSKRLEKLVCKH